jgi:hypothetical protein
MAELPGREPWSLLERFLKLERAGLTSGSEAVTPAPILLGFKVFCWGRILPKLIKSFARWIRSVRIEGKNVQNGFTTSRLPFW